MLAKMEASLKVDIAAVRTDIGQVLGRVEEAESRLDDHDQRFQDISNQIKNLQSTNRYLLYKIEDQENRSRRNNLRIKGLPEKYKNEDLTTIIQQ